MEQNSTKMQSLALMPTWSVAIVMTIFVVVSLLVERSIRRLSNWLRKTNRKPLFEAVEKMKEDLMLLGFISLLLTATSGAISNICILTSFYLSVFSPFAPNLGFRMALKIMFHSFISVIHLLVGVVYCLVSWAVGLPKQAPINKELLTVLTPVTFCYALGHVMSNVSLAAIAVSFTHTIREVSPPRMPVDEIQLHRKLLKELLGNMSHSSVQFLCVKRGRDVSK